MFRRVFYENWSSIVPIVAFILTFAVFLVASIRALLTRKEQVQHMAMLPLEDAPATPVQPAPLPHE